MGLSRGAPRTTRERREEARRATEVTRPNMVRRGGRGDGRKGGTTGTAEGKGKRWREMVYI
jgi:hypothetical protein